MGRLYVVAAVAAAAVAAALAASYAAWPEPEPHGIAALEAGGSPPLGDAAAPLTVIEWGDYQCTFCYRFHQTTMGTLLEEYVESGKVRIIFQDFPLNGPDSVLAAQAARCAADQDLFWEYHDAVYSTWDGENTGWASLDGLRQYAGEAGVDVGAWNGCMLTGAHHNKATASSQAARDLGIGGTPAFFVIAPNGAALRIPGAQPYDVFQSVFDDIMAVSGAQPAVAP